MSHFKESQWDEISICEAICERNTNCVIYKITWLSNDLDDLYHFLKFPCML